MVGEHKDGWRTESLPGRSVSMDLGWKSSNQRDAKGRQTGDGISTVPNLQSAGIVQTTKRIKKSGICSKKTRQKAHVGAGEERLTAERMEAGAACGFE